MAGVPSGSAWLLSLAGRTIEQGMTGVPSGQDRGAGHW